MPQAKLTVVLPVRNGQDRIASRVERVLDALIELTNRPSEVVIVDDGSKDATLERVEDLKAIYPQVRVAHHDRPRGMEAAGQTGLERATGELVFIQESDEDVRPDDLRQLFTLAQDHSIVAARAESKPQPVAAQLLRRLRAWGTDADEQVEIHANHQVIALQMIRRRHMQRLAAPMGDRIRLRSETNRISKVGSR